MIDLDSTQADSNEGTAQIDYLYHRILGVNLQSLSTEQAEEIRNTYIYLWKDLYQIESSTSSSWTGVLIAMLRDPEFLLY